MTDTEECGFKVGDKVICYRYWNGDMDFSTNNPVITNKTLLTIKKISNGTTKIKNKCFAINVEYDGDNHMDLYDFEIRKAEIKNWKAELS